MDFAFWGTVPPELAEFKDGLERALEQHGYDRAEDAGAARLVINFVDADDPRPFRRQKKSTFVASFWYAAGRPGGLRASAPTPCWCARCRTSRSAPCPASRRAS